MITTRFYTYLIITAMLLLMGMPLLAQENDEMPPFRADHIIETAEIEMTENGAELVLTGSLPDGCDIPATIETERQREALYVEIYRDVPADTMCPMILVTFEERINLDDLLFTLDENETLPVYLLINSANAFMLNYAQVEPMPGGADTPPPPPPLLTRMNRLDDAIEALDVNTDAETVTLTMTGMRDGCDADQHVRLLPVDDDENTIMVEVFHLVFEDQICTLNLVPYEIMLETEYLSADAPDFITAPLSQPTLTNAAGEAIVRAPYVIDNVEALILESDPPQIQLEITGIQTDSCEFPPVITETRNGDTITIEIFREIPLTVTCMRQDVPFSESYMLTGEFTGNNSLTLNVNDITLTVDF